MPKTEELSMEDLQTGAGTTPTNQQGAPVSGDSQGTTPLTEGEPIVKQPTTEPPEKQYYTAEEMRTLDYANIDTSRIAPEFLPIYKALQVPVTKRQQELASLQKEMESRREQSGMPTTVEEAYRQDPMTFMNKLDNVILDLEAQEAETRYTD